VAHKLPLSVRCARLLEPLGLCRLVPPFAFILSEANPVPEQVTSFERFHDITRQPTFVGDIAWGTQERRARSEEMRPYGGNRQL
jgi:hypothetical protein